MNHNRPQSFITKNKKRLKIIDNKVFLEKNKQFEIELHNPTNYSYLAKIEKNNELICSQIIHPGEFFVENINFINTHNTDIFVKFFKEITTTNTDWFVTSTLPKNWEVIYDPIKQNHDDLSFEIMTHISDYWYIVNK